MVRVGLGNGICEIRRVFDPALTTDVVHHVWHITAVHSGTLIALELLVRGFAVALAWAPRLGAGMVRFCRRP